MSVCVRHAKASRRYRPCRSRRGNRLRTESVTTNTYSEIQRLFRTVLRWFRQLRIFERCGSCFRPVLQPASRNHNPISTFKTSFKKLFLISNFHIRDRNMMTERLLLVDQSLLEELVLPATSRGWSIGALCYHNLMQHCSDFSICLD
jgi:hypothetical protein